MKEELANMKASAPNNKEDEQKITEVEHWIEVTIPFCKEELLEKTTFFPTTDNLTIKENELFRRFAYIKNNYEYISKNISFSV